MATCNRAAYKATIYDEKGRAIARGSNGPYFGDCLCPGRDTPAGHGGPETRCYGLHAEIVALLLVPADRRRDTFRIHCTKAPCSSCVRVLLGSRIQIIEFEIASNEIENWELWENAGRGWHQDFDQEDLVDGSK